MYGGVAGLPGDPAAIVTDALAGARRRTVSPAGGQGGMLSRLEALAAELAARGCQARLVTRPGGLPFLGIAGEAGGLGEQICALPRRDGTWAYCRPGPVGVAAGAGRAADIIAGPSAPGAQLPAAVPGRDKTGTGAAT